MCFQKRNKFNFKKNFVSACPPEPKDHRDILLASFIEPVKLPRSIDWYNPQFKIRMQGSTPSCVGQSSSGLKEVHEFLEHKQRFSFNGFDLYSACKKVDEYDGEGTYIRVAMKILQNSGITPKENKKAYKIKAYTRLTNVEEIKYALLHGPVVVGVNVYSTFGNPSQAKNWFIRMPCVTDKHQGGHAILLTGFDDNRDKGGFHFVNSWSKKWGNNGTAWLHYDYIKKYLNDAWSAIDLNDNKVNSLYNIKKLNKAIIKAKKLEK